MKKIIYILLFVLAFIGVNAQDMQYSQFFANKLDLNPAFAGSQYYHRIIMNYRNQWPALGDPYVTYSFSYDRHLNKLSGGLGVQVAQDRQANGALVSSTITGIYSYFMKINEDAGIRLGLGVTAINNYLDMARLKFPDMIDAQFGSVLPHDSSDDPIERSKTDFDSSLGLLAHVDKYHFGISMQHLLKPNVSFSSTEHIPYKITAHWGAEFPIRSHGLRPVHFNICPLFLFQKQGEYTQMNYGLYVSRSNLVGGVWLRQNFDLNYDSAIFMVGFDNKIFRLAYSYDFTMSKLMNTSSGSHEISFIFLLGEREKKSRIKPIPCPRFFRKMNILEM
jgi:type IX secretion system PorP/SprF family membrane protein